MDSATLFTIVTLTIAVSVYIYIKRDETDPNQDMLIALPILSVFLAAYLIYMNTDGSPGTRVSEYHAEQIVEKFLSGQSEA
jgi:hypothetical protein